MNEKAYFANAATSIGFDAAVASPPEPPLMVALGAKISAIHDILDGTNADLSTLRTRMFGPWPQFGESANGAKVEGQSADLLRHLDTVIAMARFVREHAAALNNTI